MNWKCSYPFAPGVSLPFSDTFRDMVFLLRWFIGDMIDVIFQLITITEFHRAYYLGSIISRVVLFSVTVVKRVRIDFGAEGQIFWNDSITRRWRTVLSFPLTWMRNSEKRVVCWVSQVGLSFLVFACRGGAFPWVWVARWKYWLRSGLFWSSFQYERVHQFISLWGDTFHGDTSTALRWMNE